MLLIYKHHIKKMKIITFDDIVSLGISPAKCFDWVENMINNKHHAILPPKISLKPADGVFCNVMPCIVPGVLEHSMCGVKVVTRYPNRVPSLESRILLMDANTGEFLALMDGTWITAMRTGAVAAHTITLLAKKDFKTIGLMGLGNTTRATLAVLMEKMPNRIFNIKLLKYKNQENSFTERFKAYKNLHFSYVDTVEAMVKGSDVVISGATYLPNDVCTDNCFDEGVLVVPIHTLGFTNCDLFFDKVFADDVGHVHHFKNFDKFRAFAEVCDVVNGQKPGRENDCERILVYNIGISVHDINFASCIYQMMVEKEVLSCFPEINMKEPVNKFWV